MKKILFLALLVPLMTKGQYQRQPISIETRWAKNVSAQNALPEYPRPQMERKSWTNLNGLWDYAITKKDEKPAGFQGQILVPYPIESSLSGVKKALQPDQSLWYKRKFTAGASGKKTLLHFGAVDYLATVYVNGELAGTHEGGYTAFTIDITHLIRKGENELLLKVWDPSDRGYGPHGKQVLNPASIYYTPSSGIWQTVWIEAVDPQYINKLSITPDIDQNLVNITVHSNADSPVTLTLEGKSVKGSANTPISIKINQPKLWSPGNPYLYNFTARLGSDEVKSYFGMRKVAVQQDEKGQERIFLNNKPYYNLGTLDQGFWPDGLYTAPSDEALAFDIKAIKAMGFNTIRKHIKVEPARWYYHADRLGMLIWQDMINPNQRLPQGSKEAFEAQSKEIVAQLHNSPAVTTYVLFNEKWGQYDQARLTTWLKQADPSRLVNGHSGEYLYVNNQLRSPSPNAYINADITDVHAYPAPMNSLKMAGKAQVCGEFGGIGVFIPDHQWNTDEAWGYVQEKPADLDNKYTAMVAQLEKFKVEGMSGSIYTQPFDVEGEQNGLMTYDREIVKVPFAKLREIHLKLNPDAGKNIPTVSAQNADLTDPEVLAAKARAAFAAGARDQSTIKTIARNPGTINGESFKLMVKHQPDFRKAMGNIKYSELMTGLIFSGAIQPMFAEEKSWEEIGESLTKSYGEIGEESYLKIKCIGTAGGQEWDKFVPAAKLYLEKYGENLKQQDKAQLEQLLSEH
ncbi:glycoside hydrolase family 2 protein [Pedobacter paludis]|uniref:Glycoside hydrolase family 2 n=1 Tax=Pedobacter paludis TaxID=2203212 RepID=A0A317F495_9SPHI|nr:sugar-binding domain-containing protein [Pedobacter paludis]PWS33382.1 glycoside hydrolase family 2 [Pedobacter paludis]